MIMVEICEMMGWTYQEYWDQPNWFIEVIREKIRIDRKRKK